MSIIRFLKDTFFFIKIIKKVLVYILKKKKILEDLEEYNVLVSSQSSGSTFVRLVLSSYYELYNGNGNGNEEGTDNKERDGRRKQQRPLFSVASSYLESLTTASSSSSSSNNNGYETDETETEAPP